MEDTLKELRELGEFNKTITKECKAQYLEDSADRLSKTIQTKIRTSFIGAISQVEEMIGKDLWGHGKNVRDCDQEQLYWRRIWEKLRRNILDNGNAQLRAIQSEIAHYTIKWDRYQFNSKLGGNTDEKQSNL